MKAERHSIHDTQRSYNLDKMSPDLNARIQQLIILPCDTAIQVAYK